MKKRILFLSIILGITLVVGACGEEAADSGSGAMEEAEASEDNESGTETEESGNDDGRNVQEFDQEIVDNENVKAVLKSIEYIEDDIFGDAIEITFEVENKRDDTIEVQAREVSADGKMVDEAMQSMSQEVAGGKVADAVLTIQSLEGKELPSMEENFEMLLHVFSWDDMDFEEGHEVKVEF